MKRYLTEDLDYVPEPIYPKYIPLEDEHVFPDEEKPLPPIDSPTAESPGYVVELDPEEDPEDGPIDYPMDKGDDGDDDDGDSSGDDADDEDKDEEDDKEEEEEEEEHLAPANFIVVVPIVEPVSPPKRTKPVIPPPSIDISTTRARITVWLQASISLPPEAEVERTSSHDYSITITSIITITTSAGERLLVTTALPSPLLPPLPPSLYIPPPVDRRDDLSKSELPPRKRLCLSTLGSSEAGYGIMDTWVDPAEAVPEVAHMTMGEVNTRVTELAELHERDRMDGGGGGLCFPRGLGSLDKIESGDPSGALDPL
ncbi:hypothetical protein Tco_1238908 [Tanacetum coccineum]